MKLIRDLIESIRDLTAAVDALRVAVVAQTKVTQNGGGGPGEEK